MNPKLYSFLRMGLAAFALLSVIISTVGVVQPVHAGIVAGYSEYYIPGFTDDLMAILDDIESGAIGTTLTNVITISVGGDNVTVYYDHWENGYGNGKTGADETYPANQGDVLTFRSNNLPYPRGTSLTACTGSTFPAGGSGGAANRCYDGRDRIYVAGGVVSIAQTFWPQTTGTVYANAWEVYPIKPYQISYTIPVGEDMYGAGSFADFLEVFVMVQATADGTTITVNDPVTPIVDINAVVRNRGETVRLDHINAGTTILASAPVQVQFMVGEDLVIPSQNNSRGYTAVPSGLWSTAYYSPVSGATGGYDTDIFIYNPTGSTLTINYEDRLGTGSFAVAANSTESYQQNVGRYVPTDSGVYLAAADGTTRFWAIGGADAGNPTYNWGFTLIPPETLTDEYFVSWSPGNSNTPPSGTNGSPVYVTPTQDNTTIFVDFSPTDGVVDATYTLDRIQVQKIFDPDVDNTGMHVWATAPVALAWGEDPNTAPAANPGIDAGYSILPLNKEWIDIVVNLDKTADPTLVPSAIGQVTEFTLVIDVGTYGLNNIVVVDTLPGGWGYVSGSSTITLPSGATLTGAVADPSIIGQNLTWSGFPGPLDMGSNEILTIIYSARLDVLPNTEFAINEATVTGTYDSDTFSSTDTASVGFTDAPLLSIDVIKTADDNTIPETGQTVTFTVAVQNTGNVDATLDSLTDTIFNDITTTGHDGITATTCATGGTILVGNTYTCTFTATVSGDFGGPDHINTVTAQVSNGVDTASDTDDETITFEDVLPTVDVTKTADPTSLPEPGGSVVFTVTVQNTSGESVVVDSLTDSIFNDITTTGHDGITATACGTGAVLLPGDTYTCTFTATITGNAGDIHTDVVTGTVSDDEGNTAADADDASVTFTDVASSATLDKTANPFNVLEPGDDVTFTVRVDNTSAADVLTLTVLSDDIYGDIADGANPNLVSTTCVVPQTLNPGAFYECEFVAFVGGTDGDSQTDTVTATLTDNEQNTLNPSDDATVDVVGAMIGVAKRVVATPVETSPGVYDVTYEILVENFGSVDLMNLEVTDDLSITFPPPNTFTVLSVSSADFSVNWPGYDGIGLTGDINLLTGTDTLAVGASGKITVVVEVIPAEAGPFDNVAIASGLTPSERRVIDRSQDGIDPDPDDDGNPTNNNIPTPVDFGPRLFDPPFGLKWVDGSGEPVLQWTMVWINNTNTVAVNAAVHDPIPVGTAYLASGAASGYPVPAGVPAGSTNIGVSCTDASAVTLTTNCYYEGPTGPYPRGRIVWEGTLGPDFGVTDPVLAVNDITITFSVTAATGITEVDNVATIDSDLNGDGDVVDTGEQQVAWASAAWQKEQVVQPVQPAFILPVTGFAPGRVTEIGSAPAGAYAASGDLRLVIPELQVDIQIVGVPLQNGIWDVTWLWKQAGWLEGSAYPTLSGNSVLTAHVYDANGLPGPFVALGSLGWGDRVIISVNGLQYIYAVRTNEVVSPSNLNALRHEQKAWLTLITCKQYDEATDSYKQRVVVRAVLVDVLPGAVTSGR